MFRIQETSLSHDTLEHSGTFYFYAVDFGIGDPGGPNYLDGDQTTVWGNNWANWGPDAVFGGGDDVHKNPVGVTDLGLDFKASFGPGITTVPEPDSLLLTGTALLFGVGLLKRKYGPSA